MPRRERTCWCSKCFIMTPSRRNFSMCAMSLPRSPAKHKDLSDQRRRKDAVRVFYALAPDEYYNGHLRPPLSFSHKLFLSISLPNANRVRLLSFCLDPCTYFRVCVVSGWSGAPFAAGTVFRVADWSMPTREKRREGRMTSHSNKEEFCRIWNNQLLFNCADETQDVAKQKLRVTL